LLDSDAEAGANELYILYNDMPTASNFEASYSNPLSPDQQVVVPTTRAGDYYVLVKSRQSPAGTQVRLRAEYLPLAITGITPDEGGTGDVDHRWVTLDIYGSAFKDDALVKLSMPG